MHLVYGTPDASALGTSLEVAVTDDYGKPKDHPAIFSRVVAASQFFGRLFPELDAVLGANKGLPFED